jgi:hypothetical protein
MNPSGLHGLGWRLSRSHRERTRREDRRSKLYEIPDNLDISLAKISDVAVGELRSPFSMARAKPTEMATKSIELFTDHCFETARTTLPSPP